MSAAKFAGAARRSYGETFDQYRKSFFEYFRIGESRIGHVRLDRVASGKAGTGAAAAADGFVVLRCIVAEAEIVHRTLRRGQHAERGVQTIHEGLRSFHVTRDDRARIRGI